MADIRDITGKNRKFTGTTGIKIPSGTQAQRVNEVGQLRFNTDSNLAEYYDGTDWKPIDAPPTITGFTLDGGSSVTTATIDDEAGGDATIVISGSNFDVTSGTVIFEPEGGGSNVNVQTITRTNSSSFTVTVTRSDFTEENGPYAIKLTNGSGLAATLASAITPDDSPPTFATAADTNIGTVIDGQTDFTGLTSVAATDADGQTITHTISAGSIPNGLSLQTNGTFTGTASSLPSSLTELTFTVQAATSTSTVTRQFKINTIDSPYMTATGGTIVTADTDYKVHIFTGSGSFVVTKAGLPAASGGSNEVDYLVVAGGGGSGHNHGAGGGAGGYREGKSPANASPHTASPLATSTGIPVSATTYPVTVGGGGPAADGTDADGQPGSPSVFSTITATGGGGGGGNNTPVPEYHFGLPGGSGGGAKAGSPAGSGNTPPVSPPQGNPGSTSTGPDIEGGGGGAGAPGGPVNPANSGGAGGDGVPTTIAPASYGTPGPAPGRYYGGGGGGQSSGNPGGVRPGGAGGGGASTHPAVPTGNNGTANTGGGAGASAASGGQGIVVLRYKFQ